MQGNDDEKLKGMPDRPNAFSFQQTRPNEDLRVAAWGEKAPDRLRTGIESHRAPEVAQASWDMASHVSPQELNRSTTSSKGGRPESPFGQTLGHQGYSGRAVHSNDAVHSNGSVGWADAAAHPTRATGGAPGGARQVAFSLTRDDRPDAAPVPNQARSSRTPLPCWIHRWIYRYGWNHR